MSSLLTEQFNFILPNDRIAQHSVEPRDHSRLMILDQETGEIEHKQFYNILDELVVGDVLVFNNTKVFRARMMGVCHEHDVEVFLLRCVSQEVQNSKSVWQALIRPGKKVQIGDVIVINDLEVFVKEKHDDGVALIDFPLDEAGVLLFTDSHGEIPIPPYVDEKPKSIEQYQTVYAKETGSVAAPTAGFHFTNELLDQIKLKGIEIVFVTLHVGIGTFRPMKTDAIDDHVMHSEFVSIPSFSANCINTAKNERRRVVAVGTTTVRSLEGAALMNQDGGYLSERGFEGDINMFIKPGFQFKIIDALITNFHLPKSTLLVLVSAFAGRNHVLHAYEEAIEKGYRFFSFGDAMFIRSKKR